MKHCAFFFIPNPEFGKFTSGGGVCMSFSLPVTDALVANAILYVVSEIKFIIVELHFVFKGIFIFIIT